MSEPFGIGGGITNAHACGCTVGADGFIDITCARHREFMIPPEEDWDEPEPWVDDDGPNLGTCPYYAHYRNPEQNPMVPCTFGCWDEPRCITDEPEEGWPEVHDPAGGQDCQASHCPPFGGNGECDWPRCAER
jgi:hypothetical protein